MATQHHVKVADSELANSIDRVLEKLHKFSVSGKSSPHDYLRLQALLSTANGHISLASFVANLGNDSSMYVDKAKAGLENMWKDIDRMIPESKSTGTSMPVSVSVSRSAQSNEWDEESRRQLVAQLENIRIWETWESGGDGCFAPPKFVPCDRYRSIKRMGGSCW